VLGRHRGASASEIKDAVLADLVAFIGSRGVLDDITLFVAKRL
jgi:serine phosphatase RsbU (regulator of sigma subunit)